MGNLLSGGLENKKGHGVSRGLSGEFGRIGMGQVLDITSRFVCIPRMRHGRPAGRGRRFVGNGG
jgi:hypothetical protein